MSMLKRKRCMTKPRPASMMRLSVARVRYCTLSERLNPALGPLGSHCPAYICVANHLGNRSYQIFRITGVPFTGSAKQDSVSVRPARSLGEVTLA